MENIVIQEIKDSALLAALNEEVQNLHYKLYPEIFKSYDRKDIEDFFKNEMSRPNALAFVAYIDENAVGYVLILLKHFEENPFQHARKFLQIDHFLVLSDYRNRGVGKLLLEKTITVAREAGIRRIQLNHWTKNKEARAFFGNNSFIYSNENMYRDI